MFERTVKAVIATVSRASNQAHSPARTLRDELSHLDRQQLRDLGIDRDAA